MSDTETEATLGRWRTLKDAARLLHLPQKDLLQSLKRGEIRGTQIGNNWFAFIDPDMEAAAGEKARRREEKKASRKRTVELLRDENEALKADLERLRTKTVKAEAAKAAKKRPVAKPAKVPPPVAPEKLTEIEFLRRELQTVRTQHAEEMRRKDILLRQSQQLLQDVVSSGVLERAKEPSVKPAELEHLREQHRQSMKALGEMTALVGVIYRRLQNSGDKL